MERVPADSFEPRATGGVRGFQFPRRTQGLRGASRAKSPRSHRDVWSALPRIADQRAGAGDSRDIARHGVAGQERAEKHTNPPASAVRGIPEPGSGAGDRRLLTGGLRRRSGIFLRGAAAGSCDDCGDRRSKHAVPVLLPGVGRYLLLGAGKTVSEIKTGVASEMRSKSNSGFFLVDISPSGSTEEPDLLGIGAPAVPAVLRSSVEEIDFMANEGSAIASLAASLARSGHLYDDTSD